MFKFGKKSLDQLQTVDPRLQAVVTLALELSEIDFSVVEGLRTLEWQKELVAAGKSWTLDSYHLRGLAVDLYPWRNGQTDHSNEAYNLIAKAMIRASQKLGVEIEWGGLWNETPDKPHWQLVTA